MKLEIKIPSGYKRLRVCSIIRNTDFEPVVDGTVWKWSRVYYADSLKGLRGYFKTIRCWKVEPGDVYIRKLARK